MNPIIFALRHPFTIMVGVAAIVVGSVLAVTRMKIDIFPNLNLPVIYVCQPYGGMDPAQMEGLLTNYYEYHFLYISGIHHVESKNVQGVALMKLFFHPDTDMAQAMAETIAYVNRSRAFMPPNTVPPFVMRFDTGSVPVGYLVLSSETRSVGEVSDLALFKVRPLFASLPGVSAPPPFGGNQRTIVLRVDPDKLRNYKVSPEQLIKALTTGNTISPSGNIRLKDKMPIVPANTMVVNHQDLGRIPIEGSSLYLRDLCVIDDATDTPNGVALVNGRRAVYLLVTKRATASTLAVVNEVKKNLPRMQAAIPDDIKVSFEFDQSPYVTRALFGLGLEALLGAILTGLMVLVFLRDWRSVIVVVCNIPLALLGALVALWLSGQSINIMTLGGLALAVGILVDEATVEVENIHTQMGLTPSIARAVRLGNSDTAVPRLLAMLCILAVFLPSFFMEGEARALFVPLSLAVGFSMVASYILSSTFVPVVSVWLLRHVHTEEIVAAEQRGWLERLRDRFSRIVNWTVPRRRILVPAYLILALLLIGGAGWTLGQEIFPNVDAGQFQLRLRAPTGTRIERTEEITLQALEIIKKKVGPENVAISLAYVGQVPTSYPINSVYLWMGGPEESVLRVSLKRGGGRRTEKLKEELRKELPDQLSVWLKEKLQSEGYSEKEIAERVAGLRFSFEPADIINEVMSFGSPTPVEIVVSGGKKLEDNRAWAEKIKNQLKGISSLRDLQFVQALDYPAVKVHLDREMAGRAGVTVEDVARSLVAATSSSRFVFPNYWRDPGSGIGYQVQVEIPYQKMNTTREVNLVPIKRSPHPTPSPEGRGQGEGRSFGEPLFLQDVAQIEEGSMPGQIDRYNMRRLVSMTANVFGEDLGRVAQSISQAIHAVQHSGEKMPPAMSVDVRGQVDPMIRLFESLAIGLGMAVLAIFLLLTAYFQSIRLALVVVSTTPAVIAGVGLALLATGTTLNLQSFMGAVMALGVAMANAILLATFAERARRAGQSAAEAAVDGALHRLRPILMTSCAMIAGMTPMALALGEGGEQTAPLARAVIGGLLAATFTTLALVPAVFALVQARAPMRSASLDPDDPESPHYDRGGT